MRSKFDKFGPFLIKKCQTHETSLGSGGSRLDWFQAHFTNVSRAPTALVSRRELAKRASVGTAPAVQGVDWSERSERTERRRRR